jgi:hypothetical protein
MLNFKQLVILEVMVYWRRAEKVDGDWMLPMSFPAESKYIMGGYNYMFCHAKRR